MIPDAALLTGRDTGHLCPDADTAELSVPVHRDVVGPFRALQADAAREGFDLRILSGFRSFDHQLSIFNRKARGEIPVLDSNAEPLDINRLDSERLVLSILRWSALPGASRHHWGTDLDVFDAAARPDGYEIELIPEEVDPGGMFGPLHAWLDERIAADAAHGFVRPYDVDRGGVTVERWHLSYRPLASPYLAALTPDVLRETLVRADLQLQDVVLEALDSIYETYVINVSPACFDPGRAGPKL